MGQTIRTLAKRSLSSNTIFNNRMVMEVCESVHFHYRNLRVNLSIFDFEALSQGCRDAYERWVKRGKKMDGKTHIELCRKEVAKYPKNDGIKINLNKNLYNQYQGRVFSDGAAFTEEEYIHLKIRDLRLEMPISEFEQLADACYEARDNLKRRREAEEHCRTNSLL